MNNEIEMFKNNFARTWDSLSEYSFQRTMASTSQRIYSRLNPNYMSGKWITLRKLDEQLAERYQHLKRIAREFPDPFDTYFKVSVKVGELFGEEISVGKGMAIMQLAMEAVLMHNLSLAIDVQNEAVRQAGSFCSSHQGQQQIINVINT